MSEEQNSKGVGILVGIPIEKPKGWQTGRAVAPEWAITLCHMVYPTGLNHVMMAVAGKRIDEARCEIVEKAIEIGASTVFFLDDDVQAPITTLLHLYPLLMSDPNIIAAGGIYSPKREPTEPMAFRKSGHGPAYDMKPGEIFEVESIATGCLLVKTELFKNIPKPWFKTIEAGEILGNVVYNVKMTDDIYFCRKAGEAGYKIMAHGSLLCNHLDAENHKAYTLNQYLPKENAETPPLTP